MVGVPAEHVEGAAAAGRCRVGQRRVEHPVEETEVAVAVEPAEDDRRGRVGVADRGHRGREEPVVVGRRAAPEVGPVRLVPDLVGRDPAAVAAREGVDEAAPGVGVADRPVRQDRRDLEPARRRAGGRSGPGRRPDQDRQQRQAGGLVGRDDPVGLAPVVDAWPRLDRLPAKLPAVAARAGVARAGHPGDRAARRRARDRCAVRQDVRQAEARADRPLDRLADRDDRPLGVAGQLARGERRHLGGPARQLGRRRPARPGRAAGRRRRRRGALVGRDADRDLDRRGPGRAGGQPVGAGLERRARDQLRQDGAAAALPDRLAVGRDLVAAGVEQRQVDSRPLADVAVRGRRHDRGGPDREGADRRRGQVELVGHPQVERRRLGWRGREQQEAAPPAGRPVWPAPSLEQIVEAGWLVRHAKRPRSAASRERSGDRRQAA